MQDGECWARVTPVLHTNAKGFGSLLTPVKADSWIVRALNDGHSRDRSFGSLTEQLVTLFGLRPSAVFVEKLMGWVTNWTDLQPLGTDKFRQWLRSHGKSLEAM